MKKKIVVLLVVSCMLIGCQPALEEISVSKETDAAEAIAEEVTAEKNVAEVLEKEEQESYVEEVKREDATAPDGVEAEIDADETRQAIALSKKRKSVIETGLLEGDFSASPILLEEVTMYLNEIGICYEGYYTGSERVDITLEDGTTLLFLETENQDMIPFGYELIMVNDMFNQWSFQENYYHAYDVCDDQYYYPELSERMWEEEEFSDFSRTELSIARNELFAKHGRIFKDPFLNKVFGVKSWYEPKFTAEEFDSRQTEFLTDIEEENLQTIIAHEKRFGLRGADKGTEEVKALLSGSWIDLDGDGTKEQIVYEPGDYGWEGASGGAGEISLIVKSVEESVVSLNGSDGYMFHENCFVTSMDGIHYYLIVLDYGPSADYVSFLYGYENGALVEVGRMASYATDLKVYEDRILAPTETCHLQCQAVDYVYVLQDDKFVHRPSEYYVYRGNIVTALNDFALFADKEDAEPVIELKRGEEVKILGGDLEYWVLLEKADTGEQGWMKVTVNPHKVWTLQEEEISIYDAFEGLYFYG